MQKVTATYRDGQVILDSPVDWADGTRIEVTPTASGEVNGDPDAVVLRVRDQLRAALTDPERWGLDEALWPRNQEEIQLLLRDMDAAEPLCWSSEELARLEADRESEKQRQKARRNDLRDLVAAP